MNRERLRPLFAAASPLLFGLLAFALQISAERRFDQGMARDREELKGRLLSHGATDAQAADVMSWTVSSAHQVSSLVSSTGFAAITMLMFMGVTLGSLSAAPRPKA